MDELDEGGGESGIGLDRPPRDRAPGSLSGVDDAFGFRSRPHAARGGVATSSVQPGDIIGGVVIERHVGEGGMGSVHAGRELGTGRRVAVKLVRMTDASPTAHDRFAREARLLARLRHPNVAQLYAFGTHDGATGSMPYLVLEFVEDARPITRFARETGLDVRGRVRLLRDACRGLAHAHERGVVHRDIKPGNLLVDAAGTSRVIDFGVARASEAEGADGTGSFATAVGDLVGTLQYMSPEQLLADSGSVDARSDVYALGLVLHELIAGRLPYDLTGVPYLEAARLVGDGAAPSTAAVAAAAVPECGRDDARALATIVATCLEKTPSDRYSSAAALAADIDRWLEGRAIVARPPTAWEALRRLARRHRTETMWAGAMAVALVVALAAISWSSLRERWQRRDAEVARGEAEAARRIAEVARAEAERHAADAVERLYVSTVLLAAEARDRDNVIEATRLLDTARSSMRISPPVEPLELACLAASLDESSHVFMNAGGEVTAVALAPNGRTLGCADRAGAVWLHELDRSGVPASRPPRSGRHGLVAAHDDSIGTAARSAPHARWATHDGRVWRIAFSSDGRLLASAGADGRVVVRHVVAGDVVTTLTAHDGPVYGVAFAPDGTCLATAGRDGVTRLWDTTSWQARLEIRGHEGTVYAVAFSPDGLLMATAGTDGTARVWHASGGAEAAHLEGHAGRVFDAAFSAGGDALATAGEDGTLRLWDVGTREEVRRLRHPSRVNAVAFVGDGLDVVTATGDGVLRAWRADAVSPTPFRGHTGGLWSVAGTRDGRVVSASEDGTARVWCTDGRDRPVRTVGSRVLATAFGPGDGVLAAGLADGTVSLWDTRTLAPRGRLSGGVGRVNSVAFSHDGRFVAGGCDAGTVAIWSARDGHLEASWQPHARRTYSVAFTADDRAMLTASEDGTALLTDRTRGVPLIPPLRHGRRVFCAALSPDESLIATASEDRSARLWDARTGVERLRLLGHGGPVNWVTFSADGRHVVTASSDATVRVWTVADGRCTGVLTGPTRQVWKASFSPDGARVAAVTADGTTVIWETTHGQAVLTLRGEAPATAEQPGDDAAAGGRVLQRGHSDQVWGLAFSSDGRRLATGSWDGTVRLWGISTAQVAGANATAGLPTAAEAGNAEDRAAGQDAAARGPSWNQFRGFDGSGATAAALPLEWSETHNVRWKTPVPGKAWASPVEADGRIWLANATEDGRRLSAVCVDAATGGILHDITLFEPAEPMFCHPYNSYASPTPVVTNGRVFMHFGSAGTACLDAATGAVVWKRDDLPCDHHRGPGSSPIAVDDLLVVNFDGFDVQYVVALEQATGRTAWKTDRTIDYGSDNGDLKKAYCTPTVIEHAGRRQLVSPAAVGTVAYDPVTGRELWKVHHGGFNAAARPLFAGGVIVIVVEGGDRVVAVRPDGEGDVTRTHVAWKFGKSTPTRPSPCAVGDHLYMVSDRGIFTCLDLRSGESVWQERREGRHSAALLESHGRLYACDEDGTTVVVAADPTGYRILAENRLDDGCMASPCVVGDDLVLRTKTHLYRIGE